jgi:hypothetical protein
MAFNEDAVGKGILQGCGLLILIITVIVLIAKGITYLVSLIN